MLLGARGLDVNKLCLVGGHERLAALHVAAAHNKVAAARALLDREPPADMDVACANSMMTPLILSAQEGNVDVGELLLERSADVNKRSMQGTTALTMAAEQGHEAMVEMLLRCGTRHDIGPGPEGDTSPLLVFAVMLVGQVALCQALAGAWALGFGHVSATVNEVPPRIAAAHRAAPTRSTVTARGTSDRSRTGTSTTTARRLVRTSTTCT